MQEDLSPSSNRRLSADFGEWEVEAAVPASSSVPEGALDEDSSHGIAAQREAARRWEEAQEKVLIRVLIESQIPCQLSKETDSVHF